MTRGERGSDRGSIEGGSDSTSSVPGDVSADVDRDPDHESKYVHVDVAHDGARYLAGSPARAAVLRALRAEPRRPAALTDAVDATRTTVQRILAGFRDRNWVIKRDGAYRVTSSGRRVHDAYEELLDEIACADRYGSFVAEIERFAPGFPASALDSGTLTVADDRDPLAAVDRVVELLHEGRGSEIRSSSPIVTQQYNEAAAAALDAGSRIELLIDEGVLSASVADFEPETVRALEDDDAAVYVTADPIRYGLFRCEGVASVVAHDDRNSPVCVLESTDSTVLEWVDERYAELKADAVPIAEALEGDQVESS